jgi:AcrR family transcriptional regulator
MPRPRVTRAERKLETRKAILAAAARLFAHKGIESSSLDSIAREVGLTKGAVYGSFGSKHELIKAVAEQYKSSADLTPLLRTDLPLAHRLRLFARGVIAALEGASRQLILLDVEYAVYAKRNRRWAALLRETSDAGFEELATKLDAVNRARGERLPLPTKEFLAVLTVVVRGLVQQLALEPRSIPTRAIETLFALLAGQPVASPRKAPSRRGAPRAR